MDLFDMGINVEKVILKGILLLLCQNCLINIVNFGGCAFDGGGKLIFKTLADDGIL